MATVTENGEVSIEDQFIGRLEGFRFRLDPSADADQARTLRAAGVAALAPALSLLSDKFYNAPDTEIDVTEQGGLMWGEHAVGRLVAGADALGPQVQPFVDEDADPAVAEKVKRRLGHWIDRRIAQHFAPLIALRDDEALTGMARGIAFRLVEALGRAAARRDRRRGEGARPGQPRQPAQARRPLRAVHGLPAAALEAGADAAAAGALVAEAGPPGLPRGAAARPRHRRRGAGRAARLLPARRLPPRRRAGDPHRHARAARRHGARARRPRRLRGEPGDAVDHRPVARAVRAG